MLVTPGKPSNALADLIDELVAEVDTPTITVPIPNRPGWTLECLPVITAEDRRRWQKMARNRDWKPTDPPQLAIDLDVANALIVAHCCVGISNGEGPLLDDDGNVVTFQSPWLHDALARGRKSKMSHVDLVRAVFRNDAHVSDAADTIAEASTQPVPSGASSTH